MTVWPVCFMGEVWNPERASWRRECLIWELENAKETVGDALGKRVGKKLVPKTPLWSEGWCMWGWGLGLGGGGWGVGRVAFEKGRA